jgi:hypothetical protein
MRKRAAGAGFCKAATSGKLLIPAIGCMRMLQIAPRPAHRLPPGAPNPLNFCRFLRADYPPDRSDPEYDKISVCKTPVFSTQNLRSPP